MIDLVDDDPEIVDRLLNYLYTFDYNNGLGSKLSKATVINASVYGFAVKYDLPGLQKLAHEYFVVALQKGWLEFEILDAIEIVYDTIPNTNRRLRNEVAKVFA